MKKYIILVAFCCTVSYNAQGLRTLGKKIINSSSEEVLLKGVGLG